VRVHIITIAGKVPSWVQVGYADYAKRLGSGLQISLKEIRPADRVRGNASSWRQEEWRRLVAAVPKGAGLVALDEGGQCWTSVEFASRLDHWRHSWDDLALLIGGPDGLDRDGLGGVAAIWSLSAMTLPHALVRIIVVEQLYRGWTLLQGHPYHRA
jgi:23S rRNA (pseudouridine1915-N3)-methyltransferase